MLPIVEFNQFWEFISHLFLYWIQWAWHWSHGLSAVDWTNLTKGLHWMWVDNFVAHTGFFVAVWDFCWCFVLTIVWSFIMFLYWASAHIVWPAFAFFCMGIFVPLVCSFIYAEYLMIIYVIFPYFFVKTTWQLYDKNVSGKILWAVFWVIYTYLIIFQTPALILMKPTWYLFLSVVVAAFIKTTNFNDQKNLKPTPT